MKKLSTIISMSVAALALLTNAGSALAQTCILQWVNVDSSGQMGQLGFDNTVPGIEVNALASQGFTSYAGGVFNKVETESIDQNNNPQILRFVNGANPTWVNVNGLNWPNGLSANNVFKMVWNGTSYTCSALTVGYYHPPGDGVNGRVKTIAISSVGDMYLGV